MAILIVEDDHFYGNHLAEMLNDGGVEVLRARTAEEALRFDIKDYDAAIIDVMLPNDPESTGISLEESRGGFLTGVALARRFRKLVPSLKITLITADVWGSEPEQWAKSQNIPVVLKSDGRGAVRKALQDCGLLNGGLGPRAFIVHGHDENALLQLKNYVQNNLHWPEPVVLRDQPSGGKTLIEKFEDYADQIDCVFVLLTPDDKTVSATPDEKRRSRQNVIFELGFFYAQLGRRSGRVIVLSKGPIELPSDIHGIVWIGIDDGIEAVGEKIRREVAGLAKL